MLHRARVVALRQRDNMPRDPQVPSQLLLPLHTASHPCVQGIVRRIDLVATADLPRISAQHGAAFSPNQALRFGAAALGWMQQQAAARPGQHLRFCYEGSAPRGSSAGGGSGGGGAIRCEVLEGGALPQRLRSCLQECGLLP